MKEFKLEQSLQGHQNDVTGCQFSDDGKLLYTSSFDTRVICWKVADGSRVRTFEHMSPPPSAIFAAGTNDHEVLGMYLRQNLLATICNDGSVLPVSNSTSRTISHKKLFASLDSCVFGMSVWKQKPQ